MVFGVVGRGEVVLEVEPAVLEVDYSVLEVEPTGSSGSGFCLYILVYCSIYFSVLLGVLGAFLPSPRIPLLITGKYFVYSQKMENAWG